MMLKSLIFKKIAPWYFNKFRELVVKLPHENRCGSMAGPYQCNCARRELRRLLDLERLS